MCDCRLLETVTHFVFPDLPQVYTADHRASFLKSTLPYQRIQTLAVCRHETWRSLIETARGRLGMAAEDKNYSSSTSVPQGGAILIVGGNDKGLSTISTEQAVKIIRSELDASSVELWAVADPNSPNSPQRVETKVESGVNGFLTQPLLTSTAWDTLHSYETRNVPVVVGMACPRSTENLRFWRNLLDSPELLDDDPLFQSHLEYFSRPNASSLAWIDHELQQYVRQSTNAGTQNSSVVDGVHFMPLHNVEDMATILGSLHVSEQRQPAK
jgi:hypothetical protein